MKHQGVNLDKAKYRVVPISHDLCSRLIRGTHYTKSTAKVSVYRHGMVENGALLRGGCLWMPPTKVAAESVCEDHRKVICLSRLAISEVVPRNGASFLLGRSIRLIREDARYSHLLTYADTWRKHTGSIYLATGWKLIGETRPTEVWVNRRGEVAGRKRGPKNLSRKEMSQMGYELLGKFPKLKFTKRIM